MEENELGIEEVRVNLGNLVDDAHHEGVVTRITRRGRHVASIVPAGGKTAGVPDAAIEAAVDAAWPGLPAGITMSSARWRIVSALNAARPHMLLSFESKTLSDLERLEEVGMNIRKQLADGLLSSDKQKQLQKAADIIAQILLDAVEVRNDELTTP